MSELLKNAYNPENFREQSHKLVDLLSDHLNNSLSGKHPKVLPWEDPEDKYLYWKNFLTDKEKNTTDFYKELINQSLHLHNPKYIGHQVVPPLPLSALTAFAENLLNNSMAIYEVGPASTAMERVVIEWVCNFFYPGNKNSGGVLTSGGSLGNLTAILAARENFLIKNAETPNTSDLCIMASANSHYSVQRSALIMGIPNENLINIQVEEDFKMSLKSVQSAYKKVKQSGKQTFVLVANACSTATGSYEPVDDLADFCKENNIWLHIDAAHGGPAILSDKYNHYLKGIEKADSVVMDFHKMMLTPALTTAVLFKDNTTSYETFTQNASYLLKEKKDLKWYDIAARSIECTKKPMAVKVFLSIKTYGKELFSEFIDKTYDLAREFAQYLSKQKNFELAAMPESNIICFRYVKHGLNKKETNSLNAEIRKLIIKDGEYYIVQTYLNKKLYLRTTIMNPFTNMDILRSLTERILTLGSEL